MQMDLQPLLSGLLPATVSQASNYLRIDSVIMPKRPFRVTILLSLVLLFTIWNALRAWTAFSWRNVLTEFSAAPLYIGVSGLIWLGIGIWLLMSLWQKKANARILLLASAVSYSVWVWIGRLFLQFPRANWPFALVINLVLLSFVLFASNYWKREAHERKSEDQTIR
jgi:hypothetical protein